MIIEMQIDLLKWFGNGNSPCGIIHSCNCFHTMGGGIARIIKTKYPLAYTADLEFASSGDKTKLGKFSYAEISGKYIFNMYGQYFYSNSSRQTSYDAVASGLELIRNFAMQNNIPILALPKNMGCGLGGGNWNIVNTIIHEVFKDSNINLVICEYNP